MAEQWIIRVEGKEYGPADLATLREWKTDGRVLPTNPAREVDLDSAAVAISAKEAPWKTAGDIPGLFQVEPPPGQARVEPNASPARTGSRGGASGRMAAGTAAPQTSKPPSRNILAETFAIYFC